MQLGSRESNYSWSLRACAFKDASPTTDQIFDLFDGVLYLALKCIIRDLCGRKKLISSSH